MRTSKRPFFLRRVRRFESGFLQRRARLCRAQRGYAGKVPRFRGALRMGGPAELVAPLLHAGGMRSDPTPPSPLRFQNILRGVSSMSFRRRSIWIAWLLPKPKVLELAGYCAFNLT